MRKYYLIILSISLMVLSSVTMGLSNKGLGSEPDTIAINRIMQIQVNLANQKQSVVVPTEPLDFDTTMEWDVKIAKKGLASEKSAAYFSIENLNKSGDLKTQAKQLEYKKVSGSGKIMIPKGTQLKVTLCAGEYSLLVAREGTNVQVGLKYPEAQVWFSQGDKPYQINFAIVGPVGLNNWSWIWGSNDITAGNEVSHQFSSAGLFPVIVEGKGKMPGGATSQKFYFDLDVPPLIEFDSKVEPLKGPTELNVTAKVNAVVNYGQKATYTWNFGDGTELSGSEVGHNFTKPGKYQILLKAKIADFILQRSWLIDAEPLTVVSNPVITPLSGPVPLEVNGTVNPNIQGGPTQLKFSWELGKELVEGNEFKHRFTEPGDYLVVFRTIDKLHPELVVEPKVFLVKALAPQLDIKPTASITQGMIPLAVNFEPNLKVSGGPVELKYSWDFGDGETSDLEKPKHIFKKPGLYDVQLIVSDRLHQGNIETSLFKVEALPPEMKVTLKPSASKGLTPFTVKFYAQVAVTGSPCDPQYFWNFGDGSTSVEQNPVHTYRQDGKYTVTLEVKDWLHPAVPVKTTASVEVKMPKIRLKATVKPLSGKAPLTISCQASTTHEGGSNPEMKYVWDFGDGVIVEGMTQNHSFEKPGVYNVLVFVEDPTLGISERKTFKVVVK